MAFLDELERRAAGWVDDGLISEDERAGILATVPGSAGAGSRLVPIFSLIGAALVVLGVILVVSQNWDEIPRATKLVSGLVLLVATFAVGYCLRFGPPARARTGEGVLLTGSGIFLANLVLLSQQYNIDFNPSPLLLPVVVSTALLAYVLVSRPFILVAAVLAVFWLTFETQHKGSSIETRDAAAFLIVAGLGVWLLIAAEANRRFGWERFSRPLQVAGTATIFVAVYWLGFYRHFDVNDGVSALPGIALLAVPLALVAAGLAGSLLRTETRFGWRAIAPSLRSPVVATAATLTALLLWSFIVATNPRADTEDNFIVYTAGFWLIGLGLTGSQIWLGLAQRREWWINAALAYAGLFTLTRYFDFFSDYSQTGFVFAGAGLLFLVLAFVLERGRRALRDEITEGSAA